MNPQSIKSSLARSYRSLTARAVKTGGPTSGAIGLAADLGTPVASFVPWLAVGAAVVTVVAALFWFGGYRRKLKRALADGSITQEEMEHAIEHNGWSVGFAFGLVSSIVLVLLMGAQQVSEGQDKGALASLVPALERVQASVLNIERDVSAVKETTARVEAKTQEVLSKLNEMELPNKAKAQIQQFSVEAQSEADAQALDKFLGANTGKIVRLEISVCSEVESKCPLIEAEGASLTFQAFGDSQVGNDYCADKDTNIGNGIAFYFDSSDRGADGKQANVWGWDKMKECAGRKHMGVLRVAGHYLVPEASGFAQGWTEWMLEPISDKDIVLKKY